MNSLNYKALFLLAAMFALLSCSTEDYSEKERTQAYFLQKLNGDVSSAQWWKTCVTLRVEVMMEDSTKMWLLSSEEDGTLYDYCEVATRGVYKMTAPQGKGNLLYLVYVHDKRKYVVPVGLTGKSIELVRVDSKVDSQPIESKMFSLPDMVHPLDLSQPEDGPFYDPKVDASLHGKSIEGGAQHYEFNLEQKLEMVEMLKVLCRERVDAKTIQHLTCDYELKSNGPFRITWLTGYELYQDSHILGYYFHSPGTYNDIEFHDISETHKYDIIDGLAKVQYQIRDTSYVAHPEYGILPHKWYDANYDMKDLFGATTAGNPKRLGDQAYNGFEIFRIFGTGISRLRGISFLVDVPKDKYLGFYLKKGEVKSPEQWDQLNNMGIKNIGNRNDWKATNFTAEKFNKNKTHRSCIIHHKYTTWMGMEDEFGGGDRDCNDVIFGLTSEGLRPDTIVPDINVVVNYRDKMPWTIAFEDIGRQADYDFNDAVIRLMPDYDREECCVMVEAAGSESRMYLHYDSPTGDVVLGEIHELLGGHPGMKINTTTSMALTPFVQIGCVPWPKDFNINQDAKRFWIEIQRGDCTDCTDAITLAEEPGQIPEAMLIAGEWKWPKEGVHIFSAYNNFPNWAKDVSKISYWNWYSNPKADTVVSY